MGLFMDASQSTSIGKIFTAEGYALRRYCLDRAMEAWKFMSKNTNITVEERVTLVHNCIENYYMVG